MAVAKKNSNYEELDNLLSNLIPYAVVEQSSIFGDRPFPLRHQIVRGQFLHHADAFLLDFVAVVGGDHVEDGGEVGHGDPFCERVSF